MSDYDNPVFKFDSVSLNKGDSFKAKAGAAKANVKYDDPQEEWTEGNQVSGEVKGEKIVGKIIAFDRDKDEKILRIQVMDDEEKKYWLPIDSVKRSRKKVEESIILTFEDFVKESKLNK